MICVGVIFMKIQSIKNAVPVLGTTREQRNKNLNFGGKLTLQQIKNFSIEKKLPYMFERCRNGDIIVVGKKIEEVQKGLKGIVENLSDVVKRILFIQHGGISVPIAFCKAFFDKWTCVNIGNKSILISYDDKVEDIEPKEAFEIGDGDIIINNKLNIPISLTGEYEKKVEDLKTQKIKKTFTMIFFY